MKSLACLCLATLLPLTTQAEDSTAAARILVDPANELGPVNRKVLGQNIEAARSFGIMEGHLKDDPLLLSSGRGFWDSSTNLPVPKVVDLSRRAGMSLLRYPGGCLTHNFDWRKSVGPRNERLDWSFGLDEFLALCKAIGAEPVIAASDYVLPAEEMPPHLAELVEYLNAPAIPEHPWAMKRKEWGHPEPYGVKYFELGNESDHGNHDVKPFRRYTPEEYAAYAVASAKAMREVDPSIRIGIVTVPSHEHVEGDWNRKVLRLAGEIADFVVVHFYIPAQNFHRTRVPEELLVQACMASASQAAHYLERYHQVIREECGRDLPIGVTEFNALFLGDGPKPYRLSYASALAAADLLRVFLLPEMNVEMANYWQFLNGYWGMLRSEMDKPNGGTITERPAFPLFELWSDSLGDTLVRTQVDSPSAPFPGGLKVHPSHGTEMQPPISLGEVPLTNKMDFSALEKIGAAGSSDPAGTYRILLKNHTTDAYVNLAEIARPGPGKGGIWKLSYEARFLPDPGAKAAQFALGFTDARGWDATFSSGQIGEFGSPEWTSVQGTFQTLPDSTGVKLWVRLQMKNDTPLSGTLEFRNLKLEAMSSPSFPEYPLVTALASKADDGKTVSLIVFNKSSSTSMPTTITLAGEGPISTSYSEVTGESPAALDGVRRTTNARQIGGSQREFTHTFPPYSMTAITFRLP